MESRYERAERLASRPVPVKNIVSKIFFPCGYKQSHSRSILEHLMNTSEKEVSLQLEHIASSYVGLHYQILVKEFNLSLESADYKIAFNFSVSDFEGKVDIFKIFELHFKEVQEEGVEPRRWIVGVERDIHPLWQHHAVCESYMKTLIKDCLLHIQLGGGFRRVTTVM